MDWFSWLSKTSLDPSLVYEYGLAFSYNELEEDDIYYLSHEFLQSMDISIAKHRLEILKLARKEKGRNKLIVAIEKTKKALVEYIQKLVQRDEPALVLVSKRTYSSRWRAAILKRNKKRQASNMGKEERLLFTNDNCPLGTLGSQNVSFSSLMEHDIRSNDKMEWCHDQYWSARVEEIKWEGMFQDLKPT